MGFSWLTVIIFCLIASFNVKICVGFRRLTPLTSRRSICLKAFDYDSLQHNVEDRLSKAMDNLHEKLSAVRATASSSLFDKVTVKSGFSFVPLNQIARITATKTEEIVVEPNDRTLIPAIQDAIRTARPGLNVNLIDGAITVKIPLPTEERRKELVKVVREIGENVKVSMRDIRRDAVEKIRKAEKNKEMAKDSVVGYTDQIQKVLDKKIKNLDDILKKKEDDLMRI